MKRFFGIFVLIGIVLLVLSSVAYRTHTYSGVVDFKTEAEYSAFKTAISESGAVIDKEKTVILSSVPPVVGRFSVSVGKDVVFPYGRTSGYWSDVGSAALLLLGVIFSALGVGGFILFFKD